MKYFLALALIVQSTVSSGVDFTKLSREEPVTTAYPATFKCYVDVSLFLNTSEVHKGPVFLRISYIIGNDTLNDHVTVDGNYNGVVKQLFLDEGERLTAIIRLNNDGIEAIDGMEGSFRIVRNPDLEPTDEFGKSTFLGAVWKSDKTPLFRIAATDSTPQLFKLKITMNEHYEFDRLHFKVKVISPSAGILMLSRELLVNEGQVLDHRKKIFTVDLTEVNIATPGTYYFQVMQNMAGNRVNGIEKISYEIVPQ